MQRKMPQRAITLSVTAGLALLTLTPVWADQLFTTNSVTTKVGGDPFNIRANAAGMTADERAGIIQRNLDEALAKSTNPSPEAVSIAMINRNPVILFDGKFIATADGNSAARLNLTQDALAQEWARALQQFVAKSNIDRQQKVSSVKPTIKLAGLNREDVAVLPRDMTLPIKLKANIFPRLAHEGDVVEAVLSTDVPLGPSFKTYLPKGTELLGELESAKDYLPNNFGGKEALTPHFFTMRMFDGKVVPIDGHILGDLNQFKAIKTRPFKAECCEGGVTFVNTTSIRGNDMLTAENQVEPATSGDIQGAWRQNANWYVGWKGFPNQYMDLGYAGMPSYRSSNLSFNGLVIPKHTSRVVPEGVPMLLQLNTTTSIAVGSVADVAM